MFLTLLDPDATDVYTGQLRLDLEGPLDVPALRTAARALVARHPSLRTAFVPGAAGDPLQVVLGEVRDPEWTETTSEEAATAERLRRFDLADPPLVRFTLIRRGAGCGGASKRTTFRLPSHSRLATVSSINVLRRLEVARMLSFPMMFITCIFPSSVTSRVGVLNPKKISVATLHPIQSGCQAVPQAGCRASLEMSPS